MAGGAASGRAFRRPAAATGTARSSPWPSWCGGTVRRRRCWRSLSLPSGGVVRRVHVTGRRLMAVRRGRRAAVACAARRSGTGLAPPTSWARSTGVAGGRSTPSRPAGARGSCSRSRASASRSGCAAAAQPACRGVAARRSGVGRRRARPLDDDRRGAGRVAARRRRLDVTGSATRAPAARHRGEPGARTDRRGTGAPAADRAALARGSSSATTVTSRRRWSSASATAACRT